jgi:hypothetical protein
LGNNAETKAWKLISDLLKEKYPSSIRRMTLWAQVQEQLSYATFVKYLKKWTHDGKITSVRAKGQDYYSFMAPEIEVQGLLHVPKPKIVESLKQDAEFFKLSMASIGQFPPEEQEQAFKIIRDKFSNFREFIEFMLQNPEFIPKGLRDLGFFEDPSFLQKLEDIDLSPLQAPFQDPAYIVKKVKDQSGFTKIIEEIRNKIEIKDLKKHPFSDDIYEYIRELGEAMVLDGVLCNPELWERQGEPGKPDRVQCEFSISFKTSDPSLLGMLASYRKACFAQKKLIPLRLVNHVPGLYYGIAWTPEDFEVDFNQMEKLCGEKTLKEIGERAELEYYRRIHAEK